MVCQWQPNLRIALTLNPAGSWTSLIPLLDSSPGILVPPISGKSGGGEEETWRERSQHNKQLERWDILSLMCVSWSRHEFNQLHFQIWFMRYNSVRLLKKKELISHNQNKSKTHTDSEGQNVWSHNKSSKIPEWMCEYKRLADWRPHLPSTVCKFQLYTVFLLYVSGKNTNAKDTSVHPQW